jgi:uncharacterized membrane protein
MPYTNTNADNVQLGTCSVNWGITDLGLTKGGVEVQVTTETYKIVVDQFGSTEINEYVTGRNAVVKVPLAETDVSTLSKVIPGSTLVTDATTPTKKAVHVSTAAGISLRTYALELVLHPISQPSTQKNYDFSIPIACPKGDFQFAYKLDAERIYMVEFYALPDLSTGLLYVIGDKTAV